MQPSAVVDLLNPVGHRDASFCPGGPGPAVIELGLQLGKHRYLERQESRLRRR